jgi:hypothetical protein
VPDLLLLRVRSESREGRFNGIIYSVRCRAKPAENVIDGLPRAEASARAAQRPQVILTFRLGIIELTLASALDFSYFGCALDNPARQCSNKFDIALAYSYLWLAPKILRLGIIKPTLASALDFSYL